MSLNRRNDIWWLDVTTPNGERIRRSTGTIDKKEAQEFHDYFKTELWRKHNLGEKTKRSWIEAVVRWSKEHHNPASIKKNRFILRWLGNHLDKYMLDEISRDTIDKLTDLRQQDGVSDTTVNRTLEILRAILRKACDDWEWIDRVPKIRMLKEPKKRIRWLTKDESETLFNELPSHLEEMARFTLATGLRQSNVSQLEWSQVDINRRVAWIHADQAKAGKSITVPLNADAVAVLMRLKDKHEEYVFTFRGKPVKQVSTKAWMAALKRAGIKNFRWHDLRHTWASWHVQNGTPLYALQELGGWESVEMVQRYAHQNPSHLAEYADALSMSDAHNEVSNLNGTNTSQFGKTDIKKGHQQAVTY